MASPRGAKAGEQHPLFTKPSTRLGAPFSAPSAAATAAIVGIPFDCGTHPNRIGSRMGPAAIREQSTHLRRYDPWTNVDVVARLGLVDCGDVPVTASLIEELFATIDASITAVTARGRRRDDGRRWRSHLAAGAGVGATHRDLCIVHIDAHTDAYPIDGYNTATGFRHIAQEGWSTSALFQIGMRGPTMVPGVFEFCRELGFNLITMSEFRRIGFEAVVERVLRPIGDRPVYLCFDMDFFDPSVAPGVCTPTWGGCCARGIGFAGDAVPARLAHSGREYRQPATRCGRYDGVPCGNPNVDICCRFGSKAELPRVECFCECVKGSAPG